MRTEIRVDRIIVRAAISTLAAAAILCVVMFSVLAMAFPQTMMDFTYSLGMDKASINYAITSYARFEAIEYIGKGADTALAAKMYDKADECLERMIADERFDEYCNEKNNTLSEGMQGTTYQDYYRRQLCVSKYHAGNQTGAVDRALELMNGTFMMGNPIVAVLAEARIELDAGLPTVQYVYEKMAECYEGEVYVGYSVEEQAYFDQIFMVIQTWLVAPLS